MRWLPYFILAYLAIAVQIGLGAFVRYHGAQPSFVLLAVVFIALHAPRDAALLGCFCMGLLQDLVTRQPPGLFAFSYGLVGLVVAGSHHAVSKEHPLSHFALTLVGGLITATVLVLHGWVRPGAPGVPAGAGGAALPAIRLPAGIQFASALYTALLSPIVLGLLQRTRRFFAFQPQRRKARSG